jgi:mannose-6-phosphate isomerase
MAQTPPFRLAPYFRTRIWGFNDLSPWFDYKTDGEPIGEVWLTGEMCAAETGPWTGTSLEEITAQHSEALLGPAHQGEQFPLLVKILFPKEKLSVQVHPDDALAQKFGEPRGKTECWYALDAEPDASVALGIKPGVTPEQVRQAIEDEDLEKLMEWLPVAKGDMIFVDAGTVHAIAPGSVLLETQQTSDLTYRMYDYGRGRELHLEKSFQAMRLKTAAGKVAPRRDNGRTVLIDVRYFRVERYELNGKNAASALKDGHTSVELLFVANGKGTVHGEGFEPFTLSRTQLAVVPAAAGAWDIDADGPLELMRIVPQ